MEKRIWKWVGKVTEVGPDSFWGILEDRTDLDMCDSVVEIDMGVMPERDRVWVMEGNLFILMVRYWVDGRGNTVPDKGYSIIRFRKRYWRAGDLERASSIGKVYAEFFRGL